MISDFFSDLFNYVLLDALEERNRERKKGDPEKLFEVALAAPTAATTATTTAGATDQTTATADRATLTIYNNHKRVNARKVTAVIDGTSYPLGLIKKGKNASVEVALPGVVIGEETDVTIRWKAKSVIRPIKSYKREHTFRATVWR